MVEENGKSSTKLGDKMIVKLATHRPEHPAYKFAKKGAKIGVITGGGFGLGGGIVTGLMGSMLTGKTNYGHAAKIGLLGAATGAATGAFNGALIGGGIGALKKVNDDYEKEQTNIKKFAEEHIVDVAVKGYQEQKKLRPPRKSLIWNTAKGALAGLALGAAAKGAFGVLSHGNKKNTVKNLSKFFGPGSQKGVVQEIRNLDASGMLVGGGAGLIHGAKKNRKLRREWIEKQQEAK